MLSFGKRPEGAGIFRFLQRAGSVPDNAVSESFMATLKCELVHGSCFPNREAARRAALEYSRAFYNRGRLHSSPGYVGPQGYEGVVAKEVRLLRRSEKGLHRTL